jgi:hypothetical protein
VTRRRLLVLGLLAGLLVLGVGGWMLWPRTAITRENAAKIETGMTLTEVEAILGGPERDESTGPLFIDDDTNRRARIIPGSMHKLNFPPREEYIWKSNRVMTRVVLDLNGRMAFCEIMFVRRADESPCDMIRRLLRL